MRRQDTRPGLAPLKGSSPSSPSPFFSSSSSSQSRGKPRKGRWKRQMITSNQIVITSPTMRVAMPIYGGCSQIWSTWSQRSGISYGHIYKHGFGWLYIESQPVKMYPMAFANYLHGATSLMVQLCLGFTYPTLYMGSNDYHDSISYFLGEVNFF